MPTTSTTVADPTLEYLTTDEVAAVFRVGREHVQDKVAAGTFPVKPIKVGRRLLFSAMEVRGYLDGLRAARR